MNSLVLSPESLGEAARLMRVERERLGLGIHEFSRRSGVTLSSFYTWGACSPTADTFLAACDFLAFAVTIARSGGPAQLVVSARQLASLLDSERRRRGVANEQMKAKLGIGETTLRDCMAGNSSPRLRGLLSMASALGFTVTMQKKRLSLLSVSAVCPETQTA